ncbi:hypothetical protein LINPERHAP2_LOCUS20658 [Linum perenne]
MRKNLSKQSLLGFGYQSFPSITSIIWQ